MKKGLFLGALLSCLVLAGCAGNDEPTKDESSKDSTTTSEQTSQESSKDSTSVESSKDSSSVESTPEVPAAPVLAETVGEAAKVADYNLDAVSIPTWGDGAKFTAGEDMTPSFVNTVADSTFALTATALDSVPMRGILDQGPHCGGIKINGTNSGFKIALGEGVTADFIEITCMGWGKWTDNVCTASEAFNLDVNGLIVNQTPEVGQPVTFIVAQDDVNEFVIKGGEKINGKCRPTITSIKFYNK